jgi:hypothetical protein
MNAVLSQPTLQLSINGNMGGNVTFSDSVSSFIYTPITGVATGYGIPHSCGSIPGTFTTEYTIFCDHQYPGVEFQMFIDDSIYPDGGTCRGAEPFFFTEIPQNGSQLEGVGQYGGMVTATFTW